MRWSHLPVAGGIYDQHPRLLEEWAVIFHEKGEHEKAEAERQKRVMEQRARRRR